jgi:DNA-binding NarL/FixJ family response regulator
VFYEAMNEPDFFDLLRHEILGFISVHDTPENQKSGFLHFVRGEKFLSNGVMEIAYRKMLQKEKQQLASSDLLTERENEIMHLLHQGKPYHQVAEILHISIETVRTHCRNIYRKLDVHNLHEAVEALLQSANR